MREQDIIDDIRVALADDILAYSADLATYDPKDITEPGCDEPSGDIRLQVRIDGDNFSWRAHHGDSSYDQDHRGYWGASCVGVDETAESALAIADELIDQALDHAAECGVVIGD